MADANHHLDGNDGPTHTGQMSAVSLMAVLSLTGSAASARVALNSEMLNLWPPEFANVLA